MEKRAKFDVDLQELDHKEAISNEQTLEEISSRQYPKVGPYRIYHRAASFLPMLFLIALVGAVGYRFFRSPSQAQMVYSWASEGPIIQGTKGEKKYSRKVALEPQRPWKQILGVPFAVAALFYVFSAPLLGFLFASGHWVLRIIIGSLALLTAVALVREVVKVWATYETFGWLLPIKNLLQNTLLSAEERAAAKRSKIKKKVKNWFNL